MSFSKWLENRRELAQAYSNTLSGVPQDPGHHPEGDALIHTKLVRRAIPRAVAELQNLQQDPKIGSAINHINFSISPQEEQILALAAWLHDIGKSTATTIGGQPWQTPGATGKIQAIGHQDPEHYQPQLDKLKDVAPPETVQLYLQNKDLINFLIEHHMDFTSGAFGKSFINQNFQGGKVNNTPEMKLLLILMWADKMGRKPEDTIADAIGKNTNALRASMEKSQLQAANAQRKNAADARGPEELAADLRAKNVPVSQRIQALKKFPYLTPDQIAKLTESFRGFLEMAETQPTMMRADIPLGKDEPNIRILSDSLKQGDPSVEVYVVGGAVRDYLYHVQHGKSGASYKPKDVDLTTNLSEPEILIRLRGPMAVRQGVSVKEKTSVDTFGVVFATVNGENYEIAPFRKDIGGSDGRRPDSVERGTIHDDAMRRDLTINNLYYDFDKRMILDFNPGGQGLKDIENRAVRCVGDPRARFAEDKLRVLRLVRFFSRFNPGDITGSLDPQHVAAIEQFKNLQGITPERIESEFISGIKQSLNTSGFLRSLAHLGLMDRVFPNMHVDIQGIDRLGNLKNPKVIMAWLLRNNQNIDKHLNALKYPSDISEPVQFLVNAMNLSHENAFATVKNRDKRLLKGNVAGMQPHEIDAHNQATTAATQQDLNDLANVVGDPAIAGKLNHLSSYQPPKVDAQELMAQGMKGPAIGAEQSRRTGSHYQQSFQDYMRQREEQEKKLAPPEQS
jgi:tRNA nucleotidyltransferase/poly(A) polymerase